MDAARARRKTASPAKKTRKKIYEESWNDEGYEIEDFVIPYRPRHQQLEFHMNMTLENIMVCHRRFGKTVCAINGIIEKAIKCQLENPKYAYIAPHYNQAKRIAWKYIRKYLGDMPGAYFNESELRAVLPNGAEIRLGGADNPDSFRGEYFDGVVLDEYGDMSPRIYSEVLLPALSDRKGWVLFIGTAKGGTVFHDLYLEFKDDPDWCVRVYKVSETGLVDADVLRRARKIMTEDEYNQEYECSWDASIKGAYYATELSDANEKGRITTVPYEKTLPVYTFWDLGMSDSTAIWFVQKYGFEYRFIDYYEASGEGFDHYAKVLQEKGYLYAEHFAPHDIKVRELSSGKSRLEIARSLGINFITTPNISILDGINAGRMIFERCWFDKDKCDFGIKALRNYRKEYNEKKKEFSARPYHDWSSHAADAFRYFAVNMKDQKARAKSKKAKIGGYA